MFYLQHKQIIEGDFRQDRLEIIDGQQRINALYEFWKGHFSLYQVDDEDAKFPSFLQDTEKHPCPWGGKNFNTLADEWKGKFLGTELSVAFIQEAEDSEVRDLFIRLQSGFPLSAQEKRDAYPGEFTELILKLGGKPALDGYPGHSFFTKALGMKDHVKARQLAAQIAVLLLERHKKDNNFSDTRRATIDQYYDTQLDFALSSSECQRIYKIIDKASELLVDWKGPKMAGHNGIHIALFIDSLLDDYTSSWEDAFREAQERFSSLHDAATLASKQGIIEETWAEYGQWARTSSDSAEAIQRRHRHYTRKMIEFLADNLVRKDPKRAFTPLERQVIYWRDEGQCQVCQSTVLWSDAEIHHKEEHQHGGKTILENGVLVHKACHPKGQAAVEFAKQ